jgi:Sec-independent protein translocase protein TatA
MEILGIGPLELFFILIIALIILGPGDMVKAGRTLGRLMRKVVTSPEWRTVQKASRELKYLPNRLMREANLEDLSKELGDINIIGTEINKEVRQVEADLSSWTTPPVLMKTDDPTPEPSVANNQPSVPEYSPDLDTSPALDSPAEIMPPKAPETPVDPEPENKSD